MENGTPIKTVAPGPDIEVEERRKLRPPYSTVLKVVAVLSAVFHIWVLAIRPIDPWFIRGGHLLFGSVLTFMAYRARKSSPGDRLEPWDYAGICASVVPLAYIWFTFNTVIYRVGVVPNALDVVIATVAVISVLEVARRTTGAVLPVLGIAFIVYGRLGHFMPGLLSHRGYSFPRMFTYLYSLDGILGTAIFVSAAYVYIFILFGAFLQKSGAGKFFVDAAFSVAGRARGGPAKVAVISSALFGTISGSSAGNVVMTGSFTIPLMKRTGYSPVFAGAVEAVASTGGQIMPPVMGAGAFIMAEILGVPYITVAAAAVIPAILYFTAVYFMVDMRAVRRGLRGLPREQLPNLGEVIIKEGYLFVPLVVIIYFLVFERASLVRTGIMGILSSLVLSWVKKETRMGPGKILEAVTSGALSMLNIVATCALAGIIIGVLTQTGLGMKFAAILVSYSRGNLAVALVLAMLVAIVLGMGMPTTAAYAISASVIAPALTRMGLQPIQAHLFVFYFACISAITPPVALAAYAGAGIAKADPMDVGWQAFRLGIAAFIVPYMFAFGPSLVLIGSVPRILISCATALVGVYALAASMEGWYLAPLRMVPRVLLFAAALCLIDPGSATDITGLLLLGAATLLVKMPFTQGMAVLAQDAVAPGGVSLKPTGREQA